MIKSESIHNIHLSSATYPFFHIAVLRPVINLVF